MAERTVSDEDKALAADWRKRIQSALDRPQIKETLGRFERNRKLLRGMDPQETDEKRKKMRANLFFANLAMMRPQVYAKDPEYSVKPTKAVSEAQLKLMQKFGLTAETLLHELVVKRARLKKRAKRLMAAAYTTSVGWLKLGWQETPQTDQLFASRIKDTQDNIQRLQTLRDHLNDPQVGQKHDVEIAQLQQTLAGLQAQAEVKVASGPVLDFVMSEDVVVIDDSVREVSDYERAAAMGHRVWMTCEGYEGKFGYAPPKSGKTYTEIGGQQQGGTDDKRANLLCVWEVWDQQSNRVLHVCEGIEGFCDAPATPDWTGERWYPFFLLAWNEGDGFMYPQSDVELIEPLVREYNEARDDLVRDRKDALPFTVLRKGGSLTEKDAQAIRNRQGNDVIMVEGVGGQPIANDIQGIQLGKIDPANYNTQPARSDIEQLIGGGDAARGSVLEAKTATEAEILSQGLRSRSAERQDTMEDMLSDIGGYALQMMLRKLSEGEVRAIAGDEAVWPQLSAEQIFKLVTVEVRGGSTGKPDRLQEQDRWTKLLPVIQEAMVRVAELRAAGQTDQAGALVELLKETMRRFDERIDIDTFLPAPKEGEEQEQPQQDPMQDPRVQEAAAQAQEMLTGLQEQNAQQAEEIQKLQQQLRDKEGDRVTAVQQARINAERDIELARVVEPIKAQATVAASTIKARADAEAKVQVAKITQPPPEIVDPEARNGVAQANEQIGGVAQAIQAIEQVLQQFSAPKPRQKVVHDRDPVTNRLTASRLVDEEVQ